MSLSHTRFKRNKSSNNHVKTKKEKMANLVYKLSMGGIVAIILFGGYMAFSGYQSDVYPLDLMRGYMTAIIGSSDPDEIRAHLVATQAQLDIVLEKLPETTSASGAISKNPVWMFPTESTNFLRIQKDVSNLMVTVEQLSAIPKDSSAYNTGMLDINDRAMSLRVDIMDATPYMYVQIQNIIFSVVWIVAIIGIFAALKRKKDQLKEVDEPGV